MARPSAGRRRSSSDSNQRRIRLGSSAAAAPGEGAGSDLLVNGRTYNWPNPSDKKTHIRYQLQSSGTVKIRIISMNGRTILNRTYSAQGGLPEEVEISTESWSSGVYYAMVKGTVNGKSEKKLIKIAVVH